LGEIYPQINGMTIPVPDLFRKTKKTSKMKKVKKSSQSHDFDFPGILKKVKVMT
jgi:hypothetical protein